MPSDKWTAEHRQVKLWLDIEAYEELKAACRDAGLSMADYIRDLIASRKRLSRVR